MNAKMYKAFLLLFTSLLLISCSAFFEESTPKKNDSSVKSSNQNLLEVINKARYDVDNINIYIKPDDYMGSIISTRGVFIEQKYIKEKDKKFVISGSNNGQVAEFIVYLDHPLQTQSKFNENIQVISTASGIRVFGRLVGLEDYMTYNGIKKQLPVLEAIAIFNIDDRDYKNPVWLNLLYE